MGRVAGRHGPAALRSLSGGPRHLDFLVWKSEIWPLSWHLRSPIVRGGRLFAEFFAALAVACQATWGLPFALKKVIGQVAGALVELAGASSMAAAWSSAMPPMGPIRATTATRFFPNGWPGMAISTGSDSTWNSSIEQLDRTGDSVRGLQSSEGYKHSTAVRLTPQWESLVVPVCMLYMGRALYETSAMALVARAPSLLFGLKRSAQPSLRSSFSSCMPSGSSKIRMPAVQGQLGSRIFL